MAAIDVLIPAYNAEKTVVGAIRSIQDQTVRDIRLLVVDDGSTDHTPRLLREIAAADPRVEVITTPNGGIVRALNLALARSDAPIIARHDADDVAYPDRFARQLAYLDAHPDCVAVGGEARQVDPDGHQIGVTQFSRAGPPDAAALPAAEPYLMHPLLMIRGDALRAAGGYRHVLHAEDADLYWRLLSKGRLHSLPDVLCDYLIHPGSVTSASVHRGRVAAIYSELAALSYRRREAGQPDIDFPADALTRMEELRDMDAVFDHLARPLGATEREHLRLSAAAKLLVNATYRPYQLETSDARFIARAWPGLTARLAPAQRERILRWFSAILWKMLKARRIASARALGAPASAWARLGPMLALQTARWLRSGLGERAGRRR